MSHGQGSKIHASELQCELSHAQAVAVGQLSGQEECPPSPRSNKGEGVGGYACYADPLFPLCGELGGGRQAHGRVGIVQCNRQRKRRCTYTGVEQTGSAHVT